MTAQKEAFLNENARLCILVQLLALAAIEVPSKWEEKKVQQKKISFTAKNIVRGESVSYDFIALCQYLLRLHPLVLPT